MMDRVLLGTASPLRGRAMPALGRPVPGQLTRRELRQIVAELIG